MRRTGRQAGFTLVELMMALVIGALVVAAMFSIGGASARQFQEQQRIGVTQRSVRMAMERVRRDVSRAGYLSVSHNLAPSVRTCPTPAVPQPVQAIWFDDDDSTGNSALDAMNRSVNQVSADRLRLMGNYATGDSYLLRSFDSTGDSIFLQADWLAFRRSFVVPGTTPTIDENRFENVVFRPGTMLHIETRSGYHYFVNVTASDIDSSGNTPQIDISPAIPLDNPCLEGLGSGATVTPISWIEYALITAPSSSALASNAPAVTGPNTILVRRQLDMTDATGATVIANTQRTILEYAIDFNLSFIVDQNLTLGNPPTLVMEPGDDAEDIVQDTPWMARSAIITLAARTPEQDTRFPWPSEWASQRPTTAPLNRFRVFNDRPGAARVRSLTTEVQMPNLIP